MKKIIVLITVLIIVFITFLLFFYKNNYKTAQFGNNKSAEEIAAYILNISSYEATIEVEVKSNKNTNKYILKQEYASPNISSQIVLAPQNIKDLKLVFDGVNLKIENTPLGLSKIYQNYNYIAQNNIFLNSFIEDYKSNTDAKTEENENEIIMKVKNNGNNKYAVYKTLYVDKKTGNPTKLEVQDMNQSTLVYILYKEIKVNSINKEDIVAFRFENLNSLE